MSRLRLIWPHLVILFFAALLIAPLWEVPGLPNSADGPLHLYRSAAMTRSFQAGLFWPRWFPEVYDGLGAPTFHYYSPLFYWLTAALHSGSGFGWGLALDTAAKTVISCLFLLSALGTYGWLGRLLGRLPGLVGAGIFLTHPSIFREFYFQGDYPQLLAILLLPICLWQFTALGQENRWRHWLLAPLSLVLLVLTHNLTAMIGALFLVLYWLLLLLYTRNMWGFVRGVVAALVAALLSAFFWMPALGDVGLVQVQNLQQDFFHFRQYFLSWAELLSPIRAFDQRAANPPFPHALGWSGWLAILAGCFGALVYSRSASVQAHAVRFWALIGAALALGFLLLTVPISAILWETVPGLSLLQFPSRFLPLAGLGASIAGAAAIDGIPPAWRGRLALLALAGTLIGSALFLFPRHPFLRFETITPEQTIEAERANNLWGMTSGNEFLPRWANLAAVMGQTELMGPGKLLWQTPHRATVDQNEVDDAPLVLPIHYFPAWKVWANGLPATTKPTENGLLSVMEANGPVQLSLVWAGTVWQSRGETASLVGLALWLLLIGFAAGYSSPVDKQLQPEPAHDSVGLAMVAVLFCFGLARLAILWAGVGWFQPASPSGLVIGAQNPLSIELGTEEEGQMQLLGWDPLFRGEIQPGDTVGVRLYWQPTNPIPTDPIPTALHSFLHLYSADRKQSWVIVQNQNPGRIPTTSWLPALYYVDDLTLALPVDQPPGNFSLAVGLVADEGERLSVSAGTDGLAEIGQIEVSPLDAGFGAPQPEVKAEATVGEILGLRGYDLQASPGGPILRTYWTANQVPAADLVFFVHLFGPTGEPLVQWDGIPLYGLVHTTAWQPNHLYIDRRTLWLPENLPAGDYTIHVGLYDATTGTRMAFDPAGIAAGNTTFAADALVIPFVVPK